MPASIFPSNHTTFSLKNRAEFALAFTQRELKARYKNAFFGFFWMVLNPLFQMIIIGTVFHFYLKLDIANYFQYLFVGLLAWNFFSLSLNKTASIFVHERNLIRKANFPKESLVASIIFSNFVHFCIGLILTFPFLNIFQIHYGLLLVLLCWLVIFTFGLSLFFASLNVRFRDISFFVQTILSIWFYATPIIYTTSLLSSEVRNIIFLNPLTPFFEYFHFALLNIVPGVPTFSLWISLLSGVMILITGLLIFSKESKNFDDWL